MHQEGENMESFNKATTKENTSRTEQLIEMYLKRLKQCGFRMTNQRRIIIEILLKNLGRHLNVKELLNIAQKEDPTIGIATIYRTVDLLTGLGLLNMINLEEGFSRFEVPDEQMHFHFYCKSCGKVVHLPDEEDKTKTVMQWAQKEGFKLLPQTFELAGICPECINEGVVEEDFCHIKRPICEKRCKKHRRRWRHEN
ncbi:MAG: Fur family transcriptional regulator, ferric uptake regulator [Thermovirga sp.]|jgi:Fur family ferric uptake transcriptional regulator|nr:Fur family transcriptional regulator, ferric uptake regulator [Thermovirga sp.]MDN5367480.1 Fur family transcriptional regulator, ferric uptake regulator [Thermovirga sp.]